MASGSRGGLAGLRSLPTAAVRVLGVGVGFVVLVAALFAGVGAWQDRDATAAPAPAPAPASAPAPAPTPAPQDDEDDEDDDEAEGEEQETPAPAPAPAPAPDTPRPQDVTVQVLNGIGADGSAAVTRVRTTLSDAGFNIRATSNARAYDTTTIFYTAGFETQARFVANVLGVNAVRPMTDLPPERRLNSSVMVHVVVGADRR